MSAAYSGWSSMLALGLVMLLLAVQLNLLTLPGVTTHCGACGRIVRRRSACPCTRQHHR